MDKKSFYDILISSTPEELNEMISLHGTNKLVNAITFVQPNEQNTSDKEASNVIL